MGDGQDTPTLDFLSLYVALPFVGHFIVTRYVTQEASRIV